MKQHINVGIVGDFNPKSPYHAATNDALNHAADALSVAVNISWVPTESLDGDDVATALEQFDALWCSPSSPYKNMDGALNGIRFARERDVPFLGT